MEGGVIISGGQRYELARVQPVSKDSKNVEIPQSLAQGSEARTAKQADELARFQAPLKEFLKLLQAHFPFLKIDIYVISPP